MYPPYDALGTVHFLWGWGGGGVWWEFFFGGEGGTPKSRPLRGLPKRKSKKKRGRGRGGGSHPKNIIIEGALCD